MNWAVWHKQWKVDYDTYEHVCTWIYELFETEEEAWDWYKYMREHLRYPEELAWIERPVPFVDGRPQEPEYVDRGCKGQISMFDSNFMMELDAELEATI